MFDRELVRGVLLQIQTAIERVSRRSSSVESPDDFLASDEGIDKLDAICMMLIAIGESLKYIDKLTDKSLLNNYPQVDWKGAKGVRDIIGHHYFDLDAEIVFTICREHIPDMATVIRQMIKDIN